MGLFIASGQIPRNGIAEPKGRKVLRALILQKGCTPPLSHQLLMRVLVSSHPHNYGHFGQEGTQEQLLLNVKEKLPSWMVLLKGHLASF